MTTNIMYSPLVLLIIINSLRSVTCSWFDSDQLELFDLVEEVNGTFYDFMQLNQSATAAEVKKQFRLLSLKLHPDKNPEIDADVKFRQLVSIAEVLKDEVKRSKYNDILINGLPDWKSGYYYIRRARKLGLLEMSIIVSLITTVGHWLCLIAAHWEKTFEVNEVIKKKSKKLNEEEIEILRQETLINFGAKKPNILTDNLVVITINFVKYLILVLLPSLVLFLVNYLFNLVEEMFKKEEIVEEKEEKVVKTKSVKIKPVLPDFTGLSDDDDNQVDKKNEDDVNSSVSQFKSTEWDEAELVNLIKLTKKFPGGTSQRWERISMQLGRQVDDVTNMFKRINSGSIKVSKRNIEVKNNVSSIIDEVSIRDNGVVDTKETNQAANWSQEEQVLLEKCLLMFPKGTEERWEKISMQINGRSKEDCIARFKFVSDLVKKKKLNQKTN